MQTWTTQQLANYVTLNQLTIQLADYLNQANGYTDQKIGDAVADAAIEKMHAQNAFKMKPVEVIKFN